MTCPHNNQKVKILENVKSELPSGIYYLDEND